ncbi:MAG: chlorite dismutase [Chloroflexi bacterium]|jgi:chlorite dismutase|nr:chlorite dismutase family protein [Dehalococcoidia bacterium]PKB80462.1 MAG: chlorite dismutase [SAR202 cluster bacterium MP-SInd-SRR3963457-G1]PKB84996.1 MAG: chlorite dismutase [SAR202 cluster bacterium MP-NPac-SRR3961935-G1]RUA19051.1 MAG: chlorite dismutase [Chloroflexota bacterium]RUA31005.1 MAG: chlorite dismutase [Chloroflexota bacterium]
MTEQVRRDFVKYSFFKVDPEWRRLPGKERQDNKAQFAEVLGEFSDRVSMSSYSMVGTRGDADFLLWKVSEELEAINELMARVNHTDLARYLTMPYSYLAMTRRSPYIDDHKHEGQEGTGSATMRIIGRKYLFIYPFIKTHEWYQLPKEERQELMNEHFVIGHKYPDVKISTAYSFGLDDQEFVLGFETDDPSHFLDLVMDLRESKARPYTLVDTPIFSCIAKPVEACLDDLG